MELDRIGRFDSSIPQFFVAEINEMKDWVLSYISRGPGVDCPTKAATMATPRGLLGCESKVRCLKAVAICIGCVAGWSACGPGVAVEPGHLRKGLSRRHRSL